jgi:Fur family iron response transcriptional regulator
MRETTTQQQGSSRDIVQLLRSHGIAPTAQRVKIASTILSRPQHLSAEQVMEMANQSGKRVSKATVYNSLGLFARKGLIRELIVDPTRSFYDSSTHSHHHFYNPVTNEISDIDESQVKIQLPEQLPEGTEIASVELVIHLKPVKCN